MALTKKYSSLFEVLVDTELFMTQKNGEPLHLGLLQNLARGRWQWFVDNWSQTLYQRFKILANGDGNLESTLEDLNRYVVSYQLGNPQNPFDIIGKFIDFAPFLSNIFVSELTLSGDEQIIISNEIYRVSNFVIEDFRAMLSFLRQQVVLSDYRIGLGDDKAASAVGVSPIGRERTANVTDLVRLAEVDSVRQYIEGIIIDFKNTQDKPPNLLQFANGNLGPNSSFEFLDIYRSSISVPFEMSLENMAQKYLGNRDRYFELVTINNLQPPFVDEVGQKYPLLAPGAVNNIIISSVRKNDIPVGVKIGIGSYRIREEVRIIERVIDNNDGTLILFLSGNQDLSKFQTDEGAFVRIYAPHTVNNGSFILIPLVTESANKSKYTPQSDDLRRLDTALLNFGVDILRDEKTGGLVVDSNSNFKFAAGLVNVRQAVLFALRTTQGELPFHPEFGVSAGIGERYYGTADEAIIFGNALRQSLLTDARFQDIQIVGVNSTGTGISLTMVVTIAGSNQAIPLSFIS